MKNVSLSADEDPIKKARLAAFREWLGQFTAQAGNSKELDAPMRRQRHIKAGRRFTRDEMNER